MRDGWHQVKFGVATRSLDSKRVPVKTPDRRPGPYPYWGASGVVDHVDSYLFDHPALLVSEDGENLKTRKTPIAFLVKGKYWVNNHAHVAVAADGYDLRFLYYAMSIADVSGYLTGSTQPKLTAGSLSKMTIEVPELEEQRRIAAVLGGLDDLIDTNQQLCEAIQELSRTLYSKFARAAGGIRTLSEVAIVNPDSIKARTEGRIQYLDIAALNDGGMEAPRPIQWNEAPSRARRIAVSEDTLWSTVRPNRRGHALLLEPADDLVVSTGIAVIRPQNIGFSELYAATDRPEFVEYLMTRAQGSAYPAVRANDIEDAPLPELDVEDAAAFEAIMAPLWHTFGKLTTEQNQARHTRDELLPLLMSGAVTPGEVTVAS